MRVHKLILLAPTAIVAVALSACSAGSGGGGNASNPPPAPSAATSSAPASGGAITNDPCKVVTAEEASALAGVTFGPGTEETTGSASEPGARCTYGAGTLNVFFVQLGKAADAATASAEWDQERAKVDDAVTQSAPAGLTINKTATDISGLADKATVVSGTATLSGQNFAATTIALLKGASFLGFGDLTVNAAAPTPTAMEAQAATSLNRLP